MDLEIRKFRNGLIEYANNSSLPIEVKRLVMLEVYRQTEDCADEAIKAQLHQNDNDKEVKEDAESV